MFQIGDRVRVVSAKYSQPECGEVVATLGKEGVISVIDNEHITLEGWGYCIPRSQIELVKGSKGKRGRPRVKPAPANFLLKYDLDEDPIEEFETMAQVKDRIKQLSERSDLKRDSIVIYEVKKKRTVTIETRINIK